MTKRYYWNGISNGWGRIEDNETGKHFSDYHECINELNNLNKENKDLQKKNEWLIDRISELIVNMKELGFNIELEDENGNTIDLTEDI